jgi:hypothetical protein
MKGNRAEEKQEKKERKKKADSVGCWASRIPLAHLTRASHSRISLAHLTRASHSRISLAHLTRTVLNSRIAYHTTFAHPNCIRCSDLMQSRDVSGSATPR